jgi:hypothetical protein
VPWVKYCNVALLQAAGDVATTNPPLRSRLLILDAGADAVQDLAQQGAPDEVARNCAAVAVRLKPVCRGYHLQRHGKHTGWARWRAACADAWLCGCSHNLSDTSSKLFSVLASCQHLRPGRLLQRGVQCQPRVQQHRVPFCVQLIKRVPAGARLPGGSGAMACRTMVL